MGEVEGLTTNVEYCKCSGIRNGYLVSFAASMGELAEWLKAHPC